MRPPEAIQAHMKQISLFCGAIFGGVAVFAGVVWYLLRSGSMPPADLELPSWLGTLLNATALVALVKAQLLPRIFARPGAGSQEGDQIAWHRKTTLVGFALREVAAFFALVGAMLTGQMAGAAVVVGLVFFAMVLAWPRVGDLEVG